MTAMLASGVPSKRCWEDKVLSEWANFTQINAGARSRVSDYYGGMDPVE